MRFDPAIFAGPRDYSATRLYWIAEILRRAWDGEHELRGFAAPHKFRTDWISVGPSQAAVLSRREAVLVIFPGSKQAGDWLDNFRSITRRRWDILPPEVLTAGKPFTLPGFPGQVATKKSLGAPKVSRGFYKHWRRTWERLEKAIKNALIANRDAQLYFFGHSLGAAHCAMAATAWEARWRPLPPDDNRLPMIYRLESPRVGNRAFAEHFDRLFPDSWRIMHAKRGVMDPVVDLPPAGLGYWQCGKPVIYSGGEVLRSRDQFDCMVEAGRVPALARWRVFSRLWQGRLSHKLTELQETLLEGGHVETLLKGGHMAGASPELYTPLPSGRKEGKCRH